MKTIVVVPTYNERDALAAFVHAFEPTGLDTLVVDDASPDGTGELADELARERPWLHVLHRAGKDGLGAAYRAGFGEALARGYDAVGQMDADLSHPPETLPRMLGELERGADLVIASRYVAGGGTSDWSRLRRLSSRAGCLGSALVLRLPVRDLSGGFKLWRASALRAIDVGTTISQGFAFQVETTQRAFRAGLRVVEVPFVFRERRAGESKMNVGISAEGIGVVLRLRRDPWHPRA